MLTNIFKSLISKKHDTEHCKICHHEAVFIGHVDFNKSCEDRNQKVFKNSGKKIDYYYCINCGFCFSPELTGWDNAKMKEYIYNDEYILVDPDYKEKRAIENAKFLTKIITQKDIRHLDFGCGNGKLSTLLKETGWNSVGFEKFDETSYKPKKDETFDLITVYEVFEHCTDPHELMRSLTEPLATEGVIIFTTYISNKHLLNDKSLSWWYISPRNGHISIFSQQSLALLAKEYKLSFGSLSEFTHVFWRGIPNWAKNLILK